MNMIKRLLHTTIMLSVLLLGATAQAATIAISGTFGGSAELFGNLSAGTYPFANMFGGSFQGTFSYDPNSTPVASNAFNTSYAMTSVSIDIIDNTSTIINTITNQLPENNVLRSQNDGSGFNLIFGYSALLPLTTEDLRLSFTGSFALTSGGPTITEINAASFVPYPSGFSFLETDDANGDFWDLGVVSASISGGAPVVPIPASIWLFGSGLIGLVGLARRRLN